MSTWYSDDPVRDAENYTAQQDRLLESRPTCCECGEHIQDSWAYEYNGEPLCTSCLNSEHLKAIEYFM